MTSPVEGYEEAGAPPVDDSRIYTQVQQTADFQELRRSFRRFVFPMTAVFLSWYLLYVLASGFARDFMSQKVLGEINVAYVFGLLQFASTFLIAFLYQRFADRRLDPLAERIARDIKEIGR